MRKIPRPARILTATLAIFAAAEGAFADSDSIYNLNQQGFTLPGVTLPQGQDEVRAADGTTCRNAVGGSGAYIDAGVIQGNTGSSDFATYGRVVVPLGRGPKRLDCTRLYELEVERLQLELKMLKMGLGAQTTGSTGQTGATEAGWAEEGWGTLGQDK